MAATLSPEAITLLNSLAGSLGGGQLRHAQRDIPTPSGPFMHGPGGLFNVPQANQDIFSTRLIPQGLGSILPAVPSLYASPEFMYITGFKAATGSDPDGVCDDPRTAGPIKNCTQRAQFGRQSIQTRSLEMNRVGLLTDRSEPLDFRIVNDPIVPFLGQMLSPSSTSIEMQRAIGSEVLMKWLEVGQEMQETLLPMVFTGNPSNNSAGGGTKEFPGLDILIGTNKVDAETGTPCPSLRSIVESFNFVNVSNNGGQTIVDKFASIFYRLRHIASRSSMGTVRWVVVMRGGAFRELTKVWPCSYMTSFCDLSSNSQAIVNVDAGDMVNLRDDMRNNFYLLVDGVRLDVIIDDSIPETDGSGGAIDGLDVNCYASDIYIVPLTVKGGYQVTYWEYLDYSRGAMVGANQGHYGTDTFWTDNGVWLWTKKPNQIWCVQWVTKTEPRLIFLTPHLAARITDVKYCYDHERDTLKDQYFFVDGGVENRPARKLYADWAVSTPETIS